jgi:hypothetical protein
MARLSAPWQCCLLPGPGGSKQRPLAPATAGVADEGPIEVYRWCQPSLEVGGNKR